MNTSDQGAFGVEHRLTIDARNDGYLATCKCGLWARWIENEERVRMRRPVLDLLRPLYHQHLDDMANTILRHAQAPGMLEPPVAVPRSPLGHLQYVSVLHGGLEVRGFVGELERAGIVIQDGE